MPTVKKFKSFKELKADQKRSDNDKLTLRRHQEDKKFFEYF